MSLERLYLRRQKNIRKQKLSKTRNQQETTQNQHNKSFVCVAISHLLSVPKTTTKQHETINNQQPTQKQQGKTAMSFFPLLFKTHGSFSFVECPKNSRKTTRNNKETTQTGRIKQMRNCHVSFRLTFTVLLVSLLVVLQVPLPLSLPPVPPHTRNTWQLLIC